MLILSVGVFVQKGGPILSIEFTGGTMVQVGFKNLPPIEEVRAALNKDQWENFSLQTQTSNNSVIVKIKQGPQSKEDIANRLLVTLKNAFPGNANETSERVEFIGSVIGSNIIKNTVWALILSMVLIVIYVAFRFKNWIWGVAGVAALMHDVFITYAFLTFLNYETTLVVIAALLTLAGYSINDTIVIFDRVRENLRSARREDIRDIYNRSLNETLSRTINTSLTVLFASLCLLIWGGEVIRDFSIAFTFGVVIGSYSTVGVALSAVYEMEIFRKRPTAKAKA